MKFSPDSYRQQKSELEQKKQQALVEQNTSEVENLEQQLLQLEEQKAQFEQLSSTEIPQYQQDQITELGGDLTVTNEVDQKINTVTQETVEKVAEVTKPLSALEKARLLKEQKAQEKIEAEQQAQQQELQSAEQAQETYTQLQQQLADLENQKKELQEKIDAQKQIRKEKIDSQRSAIHELLGDEETKDLLKDADTKQEIFGDDQAALDEAKKTQRTLEGSLNELQGKLDETTQLKETAYQQTAEGKEKMEKERVAREREQAEEQNKVLKKEYENLGRDLNNIKNEIQKIEKDIEQTAKERYFQTQKQEELCRPKRTYLKEVMNSVYKEKIYQKIQSMIPDFGWSNSDEYNKTIINNIYNKLDNLDWYKDKNSSDYALDLFRNLVSFSKDINSKEWFVVRDKLIGFLRRYKHLNGSELVSKYSIPEKNTKHVNQTDIIMLEKIKDFFKKLDSLSESGINDLFNELRLDNLIKSKRLDSGFPQLLQNEEDDSEIRAQIDKFSSKYFFKIDSLQKELLEKRKAWETVAEKRDVIYKQIGVLD